MADPTVDFGLQLLVYGAILAAVPLAFVLLFRAIDSVALDDVTEQYAQRPQDWHVYGDQRVNEGVDGHADDHTDDDSSQRHADGDVADGVPCSRCGTRNSPEYTFCRSCLARIGPEGPPLPAQQ